MAYVYGHYKADTGELFYIGKGTHPRRAKVKYRRNSHWKRVVNKHGYTIKILYDGLTDQEALDKEAELIAEYGLDNLANFTSGGGIGYTTKEEHRKKISESLKGKTPSEETRKKISESLKGKPLSDERRKKLIEANKGRIPWNKGMRKGIDNPQ